MIVVVKGHCNLMSIFNHMNVVSQEHLEGVSTNLAQTSKNTNVGDYKGVSSKYSFQAAWQRATLLTVISQFLFDISAHCVPDIKTAFSKCKSS